MVSRVRNPKTLSQGLFEYKNLGGEMVHNQYAFIDEYGNFGFDFDKQDVSSHFIISAIIIDSDKVDSVRTEVETVRKKFFQSGEMKSSKLAGNNERRKIILENLATIDFHIFSVVVDKRKLYKDGGLGYKKSFHKYLNGQVHHELFRTFPNLKMVADGHGNKEFMDGFKAYVQERHIPNLFVGAEFGFIDSADEILIQLADFICGTIAKLYEEKQLNEYDFLNLIKNKVIGLREWPQEFKDYIVNSQTQGIYNNIIAEQSINLAIQFIETNDNTKNPSVRDQVNLVKFLLLNLRIEPNKYVSTIEIIRNIRALSHKEISPYNVRARLIAKLRDEGLLIASSEKGYKLPISEEDLYDFVNHSNLIIQPMLSRLEKCRNQILLATKNGLDIFNKTEYEELRRFFIK